MNFKSFEKTAKLLGVAAMATTTLLLTGCGSKVVNEGNFGLSQPFFSGKYNREAVGTGLNLKLWGGIDEFYGSEEMVKIDNIHPKDKNFILLRELDLIVTFQINRDKAVEFLVKTRDIGVDPKGIYHLGINRIDKDARNTIGQSIGKFTSMEILNDLQTVEKTYLVDLQKDLDLLYGKDTIHVSNVKISNVKVSEAIEERLQSVAVINAEAAKNAATMAILENREKTLTKEATLISNVSKNSGISVDQLLQYETIKAIKEGAATHVQVPATGVKPK